MAEIKMTLAPFMGLDLYSYPDFMKDGYSPNCYNIDINGGILRRTNGFIKINQKNNCNYFFNHYKSDGTIIRLAFRNGNIENYDSGAIYRQSYYTNGDNISMVNYQMNSTYITVICNGKGEPVMFNGSAIVALGGKPPIASFVELHNERVFMAGNKINPDRVYYSESFNPQSWNVEIESGYIDLPSWDGGRIREIRSIFGDLVVFKDSGLYRIYGTYPGEFGVDKISSRVGCINKDTIAISSENCFFINQHGLCVYNGMNAKPVENKQIKAIFERVDYKRIHEAQAYDYNGRLYMFLPMAEDCVIEYDYINGMVLKKNGFKVKRFFSDSNGLYIIDGNGYVCKYMEGDTFDTEPIKSYWKSRDYDLGNKGDIKNILSFAVSARGKGEVQVKIGTECESKTRTLALKNSYEYFKIPIRVRGRKMAVEISNINGSTFELDNPHLYIDIEEE